MENTQKASAVLGEVFLEALRLAVREEFRAVLKINAQQPEDRLMNAEEASAMLCVSTDWIYRHSRQLPFTRKLGAKALRFSYTGMQKWIAARKMP